MLTIITLNLMLDLGVTKRASLTRFWSIENGSGWTSPLREKRSEISAQPVR